MTLYRERQLVGIHTAAIITDAEESTSTFFGFNNNMARARIECVLDEFLDGRSRALHHFTRRDPVYRIRRQQTDSASAVQSGLFRRMWGRIIRHGGQFKRNTARPIWAGRTLLTAVSAEIRAIQQLLLQQKAPVSPGSTHQSCRALPADRQQQT